MKKTNFDSVLFNVKNSRLPERLQKIVRGEEVVDEYYPFRVKMGFSDYGFIFQVPIALILFLVGIAMIIAPINHDSDNGWWINSDVAFLFAIAAVLIPVSLWWIYAGTKKPLNHKRNVSLKQNGKYYCGLYLLDEAIFIHGKNRKNYVIPWKQVNKLVVEPRFLDVVSTSPGKTVVLVIHYLRNGSPYTYQLNEFETELDLQTMKGSLQEEKMSELREKMIAYSRTV